MKLLDKKYISNKFLYTTFLFIYSIFQAFYACFFSYIIGNLIDTIKAGTINLLLLKISYFIAFTFIQILLKSFGYKFLEKNRINCEKKLSVWFVKNAVLIGRNNKKFNSDELNVLLKKKIRSVSSFFYTQIPDFTICIFTLIFSSISLFLCNYIIGITVFVINIGLYFYFDYLKKKITDAYIKDWDIECESVACFSNIDKSYSYLDRNSNINFSNKLLAKTFFNKFNSQIKIAKVMGFGYGSAIFVVYLTQILPLLFILLSNKTFQIGQIFEIISLTGFAVGAFTTIGNKISACMQNIIVKKEIDSYLNIQDEENTSYNLCKFNNVSFSFDENKIINNFTNSFANENIYIIQGDNGKGKSTLLKLMCGILKCDEGNIERLDSSKVLYISEKNIIYNTTLQENIYGINVEDNELKEQLNNAALIKNLDDNICEQKLSGGETDKIKYLRILNNKNVELLILDEPFNNVDAEHKKVLYKNIFNIFKSRTIVIVDHLFNEAFEKELNICAKRIAL